MELHHIYWWNLENLFDVFDSPRRPDWLKKTLKSELKGWTEDVLAKKLSNLVSIIKKFNNNTGPDILGVCEIENEYVMQKLAEKLNNNVNRIYSVLHKDTKDNRGIDIAFIYDSVKYDQTGDLFSLEIMKRNATRDVLQVTFKTKKGNEITILGNHWPARMGGQYESEPYRIMVGETVSYWIERIQEKKGEEHPIVLMGDFNDEPFNRALTDYLLSSNNKQKVLSAKNPYLFNLMYEFLSRNIGTHVYGSEINILDQFMVSKSIVSASNKFPFKIENVEIINFPELTKGKYNTPIRFSRPSNSDYNPDGYSDHLPVKLILKEK